MALPSPNAIENEVLKIYNALPSKGKPGVRSNGISEWTVLAGVVLVIKGELVCCALATGMKSLPADKLNGGKVLHDCHAEILALRGFNLFMLRYPETEIEHFYLYISCPPCGDASMSLLTGPSWSSDVPDGMLRGREHFNVTSRIRTKPGRQDSSETLSKSCSDKLCIRQHKGVLLAPVRKKLNRQIYIDTLVCPVLPDFERCFSRFKYVKKFTWLDIKPQFGNMGDKPSPLSLIWVYGQDCEVIVNGLVQGNKRPSMLSRLSLFDASKVGGNYYDLKDYEYPTDWIRNVFDDPTPHISKKDIT